MLVLRGGKFNYQLIIRNPTINKEKWGLAEITDIAKLTGLLPASDKLRARRLAGAASGDAILLRFQRPSGLYARQKSLVVLDEGKAKAPGSQRIDHQ